jgi:hypothetical protein
LRLKNEGGELFLLWENKTIDLFKWNKTPEGKILDCNFTSKQFSYKDIIIAKIFPNPIGQDISEFIELYNPANKTKDISGLLLATSNQKYAITEKQVTLLCWNITRDLIKYSGNKWCIFIHKNFQRVLLYWESILIETYFVRKNDYLFPKIHEKNQSMSYLFHEIGFPNPMKTKNLFYFLFFIAMVPWVGFIKK